VLRFDGFALFCFFGACGLLLEAFGRVEVRSGENGLAAQGPNACFLKDGAIAFGCSCVSLAFRGFDAPPPGNGVGMVDLRYRQMQTLAILGWQFIQQLPVGIESFQEIGGRAHAFQKRIREYVGPAHFDEINADGYASGYRAFACSAR
jgi:hypothetical protein